MSPREVLQFAAAQDENTSLRQKCLHRLISSVAANPTITFIAIMATTVESGFALHHGEQVTSSISVVTIAIIAWFWFTIGWFAHFITRFHTTRATASQSRFTAVVLNSAMLALLVPSAMFYIVSWGLFFRTGRFASIESARFLLMHLTDPVFWLYVVNWETWPVSLGIFGLILAVCAFRGFNGQLASTGNVESMPNRLSSVRRSVWLGHLLFIASLLLFIGLDGSPMRIGRSIDTLTSRTHPFVTLLSSVAEVCFASPIEACLDESKLVALTTRWERPADVPGRTSPSIVFIAIESLRFDAVHQWHQNRQVMPHLSRFAGNGFQFNRGYTQSTHSDYADVAVVSSLYPLRTRNHHYYSKADPWRKTLIYDLLRPAGYETAMISAQNESWGGMADFLDTPGLCYFYDAERSGQNTPHAMMDSGLNAEIQSGNLRAGKLDDEHVATQAISWINRHRSVPFFLAINFQSSHFPYTLADSAPRPFHPCSIDFDASFMYYDPHRTEVVRHAYFNSLHFVDAQLKRLFDALEAIASTRRLIVVIYGENGEAFHENGYVTHAKPPFETMVHVPIIIHAPGLLSPGESDYPAELIDVVPSVLGLLDWPPHPNFQGIDLFAPDRPESQGRTLFLHTEVPDGARVDAVLLGGRWKFHQNRNTGETLLFDLENDPLEQTDVHESQKELAGHLATILTYWRNQQLAYYHFPNYYLQYYPPQYGEQWRVP